MKKDFRLNYSIDDKKQDLYNVGGLLKPKIDYTVEPKEEAAAAEKSIGQKAAEATIDAASEKTGASLWDTVIKGV